MLEEGIKNGLKTLSRGKLLIISGLSAVVGR